MSVFVSFAELTWPEVAALPRNIPVVLPLGKGYALAGLGPALAPPGTGLAPDRIALLPPVPFGWRGSNLTVPEPVLGRLVANLLDSLRDDGFSQVLALTPQGIDLGLGQQHLALPHPGQWQTARPLPADSERGKVVLIPIGHTEQHGHHLPLATDTLIIGAIGDQTAARAGDLVTCLPVFPYGVSTHREAFAGTMNAGGRAFEDFWLAVIDGLVARGFDRFYLISGHGGNCSFLVNVIKYAGERHPRIFGATTWLHTAGHIAAPVVRASRRSAPGGMGHAGELETAMVLHLRPDLVHMDRVVDEVDFISTTSYTMDWVESGELVANPPWDDDTATGAYGAGSLATAENGRLWLETGVQEKVAHVREIHEQHARREARREAGFGRWARRSGRQERSWP